MTVSVENPLRRFCTTAWPRTTVSAEAGFLKPHIGLSRCLRWLWSRSRPLLRYFEQRCSVPGSTARMAGGSTALCRLRHILALCPSRRSHVRKSLCSNGVASFTAHKAYTSWEEMRSEITSSKHHDVRHHDYESLEDEGGDKAPPVDDRTRISPNDEPTRRRVQREGPNELLRGA